MKVTYGNRILIGSFMGSMHQEGRRITVRYGIEKSGHVSLKLYSCSGKCVKVLLDTHKNRGAYSESIDLDGENGITLSPGLYLYKFGICGRSECGKMTIVR